MLPKRPRPSLLTTLGVVSSICLLLAIQAIGFYHDNFVTHRVCAEHHDLIDDAAGVLQVSTAVQSLDDGVSSSSKHSREGHSHCPFHGSIGTRCSLLCGHAFILEEHDPPKLVLSSTIRRTEIPRVPVILLAPKNSPPA